jgi:hypothetical protein
VLDINVVLVLSTLQVQKSKAGTGRVVGFRELGLVNAYTIEASFCGASVGKYAKQHFNTGGCRCYALLQCTPTASHLMA